MKAKSFSEIVKLNKYDADIYKFNPYHDRLGRFASGNGGSATFMTIRTKDPKKQHMADKVIDGAKEKAAAGGGAGSSGKTSTLSKENKECLKKYTSGEYSEVCEISQCLVETGSVDNYKENLKRDLWKDSEGNIHTTERYENVDSNIKNTQEIMKVIDSQPITKDPLVRVERGYADCEVGDTLAWGIRSTSRDTSFADKAVNQEDEGLRNKFYAESGEGRYLGCTEYRILGEKKHLDISEYSNFDQKESLVQGKFKVVRKKEIEYQPPKKVSMEEAMSADESLKNRFQNGISRKGNEIVKDTETGVGYARSTFNNMLYLNGKPASPSEYSEYVFEKQRKFKKRIVCEIEQVL